MLIGILALQGGYVAHATMLTRCGCAYQFVKTAAELAGVDALIIPGGESSTLLNLIEKQQLKTPLQQFYEEKKPVFGTCAGMILMARTVTEPDQMTLGWIDIAVKRNAYGRQRESLIISTMDFSIGEIDKSDKTPLELVFIRAPRVTSTQADVDVLVRYNDTPVMLRQNHCLVASFHPELGTDTRVHRYFIEMVNEIG